MINITCPSRYKIDRKFIKKTASDFIAGRGVSLEYDINLVFVGRNKMRQIAAKYKKEDVALPVLAFPYQSNDNLIGEIFICYPQAVLLAAERNKKVNQIMAFLIEHAIKNII